MLGSDGCQNTPASTYLPPLLLYAPQAKGQHEEAVKLHDRAADIRTKVLGSHHPDTATSYNQKALSLQELKRMREAREALGLALDIRIKNLGEEVRDDSGRSFVTVA